jgi:SAM-dependent methyltransferase
MHGATSRLWAVLGAWVALALPGPASAQDEVPFITTPDAVTLAMLKLAQVGPNDHVIDLGSGDGRIVITAARQFGASGLGVEIVPDLVLKSRENASKAGVASKALFKEQNLFATDLAAATVITMYLLPEVNLQLRPRLLALAPGTRIVSHDWDMGDWLPDETLTIEVPEKSIGREKRSRVHLWRVPAQVQGLWCAPGGSLRINQRFQQFSAVATRVDPNAPDAAPVVFDGRIQGHALSVPQPQSGQLRKEGASLVLDAAAGRWNAQRFERASGSRCG